MSDHTNLMHGLLSNAHRGARVRPATSAAFCPYVEACQMTACKHAQFSVLQEYLSLPAGSWTFQARATDLAGNVEGITPPSRPSKTWTVALPALYAIITGTHPAHCPLKPVGDAWAMP